MERPLWNKACTMFTYLEVRRMENGTPVQLVISRNGLKNTTKGMNQEQEIEGLLNWLTMRRAIANTMHCGGRNILKPHMARDT